MTYSIDIINQFIDFASKNTKLSLYSSISKTYYAFIIIICRYINLLFEKVLQKSHKLFKGTVNAESYLDFIKEFLTILFIKKYIF